MGSRKGTDYWLHKLATLKVDRSRGDPAPHKPFLLLVVLEMAERGEFTGPVNSPLSAISRTTSSRKGLCGAGSPRDRSIFSVASLCSQ